MLTYEADSGYRITHAGRFVDTVLSFLRARLHGGSLLPTVEGIDYMLRLGVDPLKEVLLLQSQLEDLGPRWKRPAALTRGLFCGDISQLREALDLSERIRTVLAHVVLRRHREGCGRVARGEPQTPDVVEVHGKPK